MVSEAEVLDQPGEVIEWDINDPALASYSPDIDTEEVPKQMRMAPPSDGYHWVRARLGNRTGGPVYIKGSKVNGQIVDGKTVAMIDCRVYDRDTGQEGAFLKTWYPTTQVFRGSKGSQLTAICFLAGDPVRSTRPGGPSLIEIKNHVEEVFAKAGEEGILLFIKTRWIKSVPKVVELLNEDGSGTGILQYVYKPGTGIKDYDEVKGETKIKKLAALHGIPEDQAHIFQEPVTGEERTVQAEVVSLEDPSKFDFGE